MFTETAVSMQWLEVEQHAWWTKGDTDAYIYFHWQWNRDNALGKKIEKRKSMLYSRVGSFHFQLHTQTHTHTQWSHELADWVAFLSWSFARMKNNTPWSSAGFTRRAAKTKKIQISEKMCIRIIIDKAKGLPHLETVFNYDKANPCTVFICDRVVFAFLLSQAVLNSPLNEFICWTKVIKVWKLSTCWLVLVKVLHW